MKALLTVAVTNSTPDIVPDLPETPPVSGDSLLVIVPVIASAFAFCVRELIKHYTDEMKAKVQAELDEERALQQERTALIEDLRTQNRMLMQEVFNLRRVMELSGPPIEPPKSKV